MITIRGREPLFGIVSVIWMAIMFLRADHFRSAEVFYIRGSLIFQHKRLCNLSENSEKCRRHIKIKQPRSAQLATSWTATCCVACFVAQPSVEPVVQPFTAVDANLCVLVTRNGAISDHVVLYLKIQMQISISASYLKRQPRSRNSNVILVR